MDDTELVARCQTGHPEAFAVLVQRWHARLFNFVLRYTGNREDAADLCQEVFVAAHRRLHALRAPERFSSWLYRIAVNACHDLHRTRRAHDALGQPPREPLHEPPSERLSDITGHTGLPAPVRDALVTPVPAADDAVHQRQLAGLLQRALAALPAEQRAVVVLKEYEGLKFTAIAAALQIPESTAKTRLYSGLKALRQTLEDWGISQESIDGL